MLIGIVALMWVIEVINTLDSNSLDFDGIYPRNFDRLWGVVHLAVPARQLRAPDLEHDSVPVHGGDHRLAGRGPAGVVTAIVIVVGGIGTWLIAPAGAITVGASGVVFGYAAYLLTRGLFDRSVVELLIGLVVGVVWGGALLSSLVPHYGISWQAHACGAVGGVIAAWVLANDRSPAPALPSASQSAGALTK